MKNKQIIDAWNQIGIDGDADTKMLHAILARKCALEKKQEQRDTAFLCFIQIILFVMAFSIVVIVLITSPKIVGVLLIGHVILGGFISVIIILLHSKNYKRGSNEYD